MSIGEICTRDVIVAFKDDSIVDIAKLMRKYHVGDIVIVDNQNTQRRPIGIITDRDIVLEVVANEVDISQVTGGDIISYELLNVNENDELSTVLEQMRLRGVRRIPVTGDSGELVGIVTENDIIEIISEQLSDLVTLNDKGTHHEQVGRA